MRPPRPPGALRGWAPGPAGCPRRVSAPPSPGPPLAARGPFSRSRRARVRSCVPAGPPARRRGPPVGRGAGVPQGAPCAAPARGRPVGPAGVGRPPARGPARGRRGPRPRSVGAPAWVGRPCPAPWIRGAPRSAPGSPFPRGGGAPVRGVALPGAWRRRPPSSRAGPRVPVCPTRGPPGPPGPSVGPARGVWCSAPAGAAGARVGGAVRDRPGVCLSAALRPYLARGARGDEGNQSTPAPGPCGGLTTWRPAPTSCG